MFSSGDRRRLDQEGGFWFKPFGLQQPTRPTPLPTQTTQTVTATPPPQPPAAGKPSPATHPLGSTPSQAQPAVRSTSTASRVPHSSTASPTAPGQVPVLASTMSPTATRQAPRRASPSQTQRQSPLKPGPQPKQTNVSTKIPPPSGPSSSSKPPTQTQSSTEKSTEPQEDLKGLNTKPMSQVQEVPTSRLPRPKPEPTKIVDVEPTKPASPSVIKHEDEPKTISNEEVVKSATKVEIVDRTSATNLGSKQHKSEDEVKAHSKQKQTPPPPPKHGTKVDHGALIPHQGTETKKESHQEKQRQTSTHSRKTDSSAEMHDAVNTANSDVKETKAVVQVKQKDKHLEGEVYQKEKLPQHVDQAGTHRDAKEGITRLLHKKADDGPQTKSGEDEPVRVVTLAGENRGAQMDINNGSSKRKDGALHIHRSHKLEDDDKGGRFGDDEESHKVSQDSEKPLTAYINNNTQSVNNSILYHSACNSNNPGVHLNVTHTTVERTWQPRRDDYGGIDKPGITSQAHRLIAEPSVRRRCLRSLFMESSDSDLENAGKPRRHGCRYVCPVERVAPLGVTSEELNTNSNE